MGTEILHCNSVLTILKNPLSKKRVVHQMLLVKSYYQLQNLQTFCAFQRQVPWKESIINRQLNVRNIEGKCLVFVLSLNSRLSFCAIPCTKKEKFSATHSIRVHCIFTTSKKTILGVFGNLLLKL